MNDGKTLFALILGAAVGSLITWKVVTDKYERMIDDIYAEMEDEEDETINEEPETPFDGLCKEIDEYEATVAQSGYAAAFEQPVEDEATDDTEQEGDEEMEGPRVVSPEEFDDCEYPVVEFTYYSDGFLTDEDDEIVNDIVGTVGKGFDAHFGDYVEDPDTVYIISDADQVCYEICRDNRKYMDVRAQYYDNMED